MERLHLISSPNGYSLAKSAFCPDENNIFVFIGDSVTVLLEETFLQTDTKNVHALVSDCSCRGINNQLPSDLSLIDDAKMVKLCAQAIQVISW